MIPKLSSSVQSNFDLKRVSVELIREARPVEHAYLSLGDLEALRTSSSTISASKFGLETICGASCETGAQ